MAASRIGPMRSYRSERRRPHAPASAQVAVEVGERCEVDELDHFLVDRWALFAERRGRLGVTLATHDPWPLHHARVLSLSQSLTPASGLPARVHHSPGVAVRVGRWHLR
jgi:uncharacterized protein YqjF (DUF2071 family)